MKKRSSHGGEVSKGETLKMPEPRQMHQGRSPKRRQEDRTEKSAGEVSMADREDSTFSRTDMMGKNQDHPGLWRREREPEETHGGWPRFPQESGHQTTESGLATVVSE